MRAGFALPILALALLVTGCGSDEEGKPIPQASVSEIERQLDNIRGQIENGSVGACDDITADTFPALEGAVDGVPGDVDADVRDALRSSIDRLSELVQEECDQIASETETTPEQTETITIETVPEETVPEETTPEETVPEETTPEEPDGDEPDGGTEPGGGGTGGGVPAPGDDE